MSRKKKTLKTARYFSMLWAGEPHVFCIEGGAGYTDAGYKPAGVTCLTEQGTPVEMDLEAARKIARHGEPYNPYKAPERAQEGQRSDAGARQRPAAIELARDTSLPLAVRRRAVVIARHFPTIEDVSSMARFRQPSGLGMSLDVPSEGLPGDPQGRFGPLRHATRLAWPED